jgi:Zn-dependent peptidase ImmA (M78 family)
MDYAGVKYLWTPAIVVNMEAESGQKRWKRTFLHEMGHYLHWKEDPARFEKESGKEQEQRAREFAELKTLSL